MSHIDYAEQPCKARLRITECVYRGIAGHSISGTDTRGRYCRVFVPGDRDAAQTIAQRIRDGLPPFGSDR